MEGAPSGNRDLRQSGELFRLLQPPKRKTEFPSEYPSPVMGAPSRDEFPLCSQLTFNQGLNVG